jgi:hypothetical protein
MNINGGLSYSCDDGQTWTSVSWFNTVKLQTVSFSPAGKIFWGGFGNVYTSSQVLSVSTNALTIAHPANSSKTFDIDSNTDWNVTSDQIWLSVGTPGGSGNATITITAQANPTAIIRTANVTVSGTGVATQTITVTQDALPAGIPGAANPTIRIYPSPANKLLFIEGMTKNATVSIFSLSGEMVLNKVLRNNQLDVSDLSKGIYIIRVLENSGITTKNFVKQ